MRIHDTHRIDTWDIFSCYTKRWYIYYNFTRGKKKYWDIKEEVLIRLLKIWEHNNAKRLGLEIYPSSKAKKEAIEKLKE